MHLKGNTRIDGPPSRICRDERGGTVLPADTDPPDGYLVIPGEAAPVLVDVVAQPDSRVGSAA